MNIVKKLTKLTDGREVILRELEYPGETEALLEFFTQLPAELRNYLRFDVTDRDLLEKRLLRLDNTNTWILLAVVDEKIAGQASLDREPFTWTRHVASIRTVVVPEFDKLGVWHLLYNEMVAVGQRVGIERLFTEVQLERRELIAELERNGFDNYVTKRQYAKDLKGRLHDVVVMSNDLQSVWDQLKERLIEMDLRLPDIHGGS